MAELAPEIVDWIQNTTGRDFVGSRQVTAGGRSGHFVDLSDDSGTLGLFLQLGRGASAAGTSFMPIEREAEVYRALAPTGIPVPKVWGVDGKLQTLLLDRIPGRTWMHPPATAEEQLSVARDFIRHLAAWHRISPSDLNLPSLKPVLSVREHQRLAVAEMRARSEAARHPLEPMLRISLEFLETHLPDYDGTPVLVQGDTGPGNLMFGDGKVTGVIDWELAHLGDPMDDIAWLSWRTTQHTFTHLPDRLREYEELSGIRVDEDRVHYYRVNACVRLASSGSGPWGGFGLVGMGVTAPKRDSEKAVTAESDRGADGSAFIFTILHRRMRLEALMAALRIPAPDIAEIVDAPAKEYGWMYEAILNQLRTAASRIEDRAAGNLVKGVARTVKFLKEADRNAVMLEAQERADIGTMLGRNFSSLTAARQSLYAAAIARKVSDEDYILYHWRRLLRDEHLMREAAGSLYKRSWPRLR